MTKQFHALEYTQNKCMHCVLCIRFFENRDKPFAYLVELAEIQHSFIQQPHPAAIIEPLKQPGSCQLFKHFDISKALSR